MLVFFRIPDWKQLIFLLASTVMKNARLITLWPSYPERYLCTHYITKGKRSQFQFIKEGKLLI